MMRGLTRLVLTLAFGGFLLTPRSGEALTIEFTAVDLPDLVAGDDLWRYDYVVSSITVNQFEVITVYFDRTFYRDLSSPATLNPSWDLVVLQPDLLLPDDGSFNAVALADNAPLLSPFTVDFVFLGGIGSKPGSQSFEFSAFDADLNFLGVIDSGETARAGAVQVPEAGSFPLLLTGLTVLTGLVRRRAARPLASRD